MATKRRTVRDANRDCASIWFLRLERARNLEDAEAIVRAEQKLRELGIRVNWDQVGQDPQSFQAQRLKSKSANQRWRTE